MTTTSLNSNEFIWTLDGITNRFEAFKFIKLFENYFHIYSYSEKKIFADYEFIFPNHTDQSSNNLNSKIAILTKHSHFKTIFNNIPDEAIKDVNISIFPGDIIGKPGLQLKIPSSGLCASKIFPLKEGIAYLIESYRNKNSFFLPILLKGDLKEYENRMPCLYLHQLDFKTITNCLSQSDSQFLQQSITESLINLLKKC